MDPLDQIFDYWTDEKYCIIELYPTGCALVDIKHFELVIRYRWLLQKDHRGFYASRKATRKGKTVYVRLHREVTGCTSEQSVHCKNGYLLDCRESNLAVYTYSENQKPIW